MYLMQNDVTSEVKYRIRLAIEELVQQILLPRYDEPFIRVKVEYSSGNGECEVLISYKGEAFDIQDADNGISLALLKNTAKELEYGFDGGNDEPNCVRILIKQTS